MEGGLGCRDWSSCAQLSVASGSGVSLTSWGLAELVQYSLEARGQFNVADRPQCIDDDVELDGRDDEVQAIGIDIEPTLTIRIGRAFRWHDSQVDRAGRCSPG